MNLCTCLLRATITSTYTAAQDLLHNHPGVLGAECAVSDAIWGTQLPTDIHETVKLMFGTELSDPE